jgi:hypothetical protein
VIVVLIFENRPSGKQFKTNIVEGTLSRKIKLHDIISFKYKGSSQQGTPSHPKIFRIIRDKTWLDVLASYDESDSSKGMKYALQLFYVDFSFTDFPTIKDKVHGCWTKDDGALIQRFFVSLAIETGFDPLNVNNWYSIQRKDFHNIVVWCICPGGIRN